MMQRTVNNIPPDVFAFTIIQRKTEKHSGAQYRLRHSKDDDDVYISESKHVSFSSQGRLL